MRGSHFINDISPHIYPWSVPGTFIIVIYNWFQNFLFDFCDFPLFLFLCCWWEYYLKKKVLIELSTHYYSSPNQTWVRQPLVFLLDLTVKTKRKVDAELSDVYHLSGKSKGKEMEMGMYVFGDRIHALKFGNNIKTENRKIIRECIIREKKMEISDFCDRQT